MFPFYRKNVVDIHGFQYRQSPFIAKCVRITDDNGQRLGSFMFAPPLPFDQLSPAFREQCKWLTRHIHRLYWGSGRIPYACASRVIIDCLTSKIIEVCGHQKKRWMQEILPADYTVIDVSEIKD